MFGVGVVVDWFLLVGDVFDGEYWEVIDFVVVVGVIVIGIFVGYFVGVDYFFEDDFGVGWYL